MCFSDLWAASNSQQDQGMCGWVDKRQLLNFCSYKLTLHYKREPPRLYLPAAPFTFSSISCILNWAPIPGTRVSRQRNQYCTKPPSWCCHPAALQGLPSTSHCKKRTGETSPGDWYHRSLCHMAQGPSIFLSWMMKLFSQFNDATRDLDGGFGW